MGTDRKLSSGFFELISRACHATFVERGLGVNSLLWDFDELVDGWS